MKQFYMKFYTLLLCLVIGGGNLWADSPWSVTSFSGSISNNSITINNATWKLTASTVGSNTNGAPTMSISASKLKFGNSKSQFWSSYTLSTDYFKDYNVTKVVIGCYDNGGTESVVEATQGSVTIGSGNVSTTTTSNTVTLNDASGNGGTLDITFTSTKQASYITSISVYYLENDAEEIKVTGVSLNQNSVQILDGETVDLVATIAPSNASNKKIVWTSSDTNIAKVSNGVVTGISEGTATVTVATEDGNKTASCLVTVKLSDIHKVKYTYNFNDKNSYPERFPTSGTKTASNEEFVISGHPIVINAKDSYYIINNTTENRGLFFGKTSTSNSKPIDGTSYLGFPAKEGYKLTKVVATLTNGCAGGLPVNIYESSSWKEKSTSVNTVNGKKEVLEFKINEPEENTAYRLTAGGSSGKNLQFDNIVLTYTKVETLPLAAKLASDNYATFSLDRAVEFENAVVYTVSASGETLNITPVESKKVPANTGVLIKSENTEEKYSVIDSAEALEGNMLLPASKDMSEVSGCQFYKLAYDNYTEKTGLGFYWGADNGGTFACKAGTAYLAVPASAGVKSFVFADNATAIKSVAVPTVDANAPVYNMAGQRVSANTKGIVFQNGKKYFNK